jgi:acyl-[acyl-carrier-protein]-phospholipid O-acyltransferase/long-chain-fatty-acid--[acyl-carrier-protein] ligase
MLQSGCNPLTIPAEYIQVEAIPKLGSGNTDFHQAKLLAEKRSVRLT